MNSLQAGETAPSPLRSRPAPHSEADLAPVVVFPRQGPGSPAAQPRPPAAAGSESVPAPPTAAPEPSVLEPNRAERALVVQMAGTIGQAALEVLNGARSIQQLARWLDVRSFDALSIRSHLAAAAEKSGKIPPGGTGGNVHPLHSRPVVRSVHASAVRPGVYEAALVLGESDRVRAMALRFEEAHGTWKVTAMHIG